MITDNNTKSGNSKTSNNTMRIIENQEFGGERPLYGARDTDMRGVTIHAGESALKHCENVFARKCVFEGKYPFWHTNGFTVEDCHFAEGARAAIWYIDNLVMRDTVVDAPKMFRDSTRIVLINTKLTNALETLWHCENIQLDRVQADHADYIFMHCDGALIDRFTLNGNYSFQYTKNVRITNSTLNTKDAFWNTENITVENCTIIGEYLGWHSKNLRLVNCHIGGTQPLCYAENLVLENCTFEPDCDLAFEYSTVLADIKGHVTSVKNPTSGLIRADSIGEIILDENIRQPADCKIISNIAK